MKSNLSWIHILFSGSQTKIRQTMRNLQPTITPPKFNSSPVKNGGWKTSLSYLGLGNFSGVFAVKLREGTR